MREGTPDVAFSHHIGIHLGGWLFCIFIIDTPIHLLGVGLDILAGYLCLALMFDISGIWTGNADTSERLSQFNYI